MHKQVKAFYDMAFEYHIAAVTLWTQIVSAPYLYNPISYLLRHTIELQLKGLIVCELRKDNSFLKISEIKTPVGKMNTVHSVKALWEYYQQLCQEHKHQMDDSDRQLCMRVLSKIDKKDFSSTHYRYPFSKKNSTITLEPIKISFDDKAPDLSSGIPSFVIGATKEIGVISKGVRLIRDTEDIFDVVEVLFERYE